jgi:small-conductance mechanosensitive channel
MTTIVAATGVSAWILLIGAAIAGLAFGMLLNGVISGRSKKK